MSAFKDRLKNQGKEAAEEVEVQHGLVGIIRPADVREKIKKGNIGKTQSDETKAKISAANKGKKKSAETKEKLRKALQGRPRSDETKAKISATLLGSMHSKGRAVIIDGFEYPSIALASKDLDMHPGVIRWRVFSGSPQFSNYKLAEKIK